MRHLIFVKKDQLKLIRESRNWFIGGTYKMVSHPFVQLITIHRFVRSGDNSKQVPIVYMLLSRRRRSDYIKVLTCLKEHLGQPQVEAFMLDFDADIWEAVRQIFPGKIMKGCNFQWSTQVYRQIQKAGLSAEYKKKEGIYRCLRNFMCLPYLPTGHIKPSFEKLREFAAGATEPVKRVISYIDTAWISSAQWGPENWSVYGQQVRTNNDVKGWHSRITGRAGWFKLPVYDLTELLFKEARWVDYEIRCVSEHMTSRYQRKKYVQINKELSRVWNDYAKHNITTSGLLREVNDITGTGR
ncbi:uncharacterized protein LOC132757927 [Ruditapes philippinarum]|uniref:uncharacterized protein LOC132757927 n=1 Tax=Ruditapes philippinarum TaxID=129788 RepID=UPI00295BEDE1|nr:uncharacterized protein LOC132757927 [Ruditapes philippinarum]